jgi:hypothetical protein
MYNFTNVFRADVDRIAEELGLINTTSARQVKNGTIELTDPVTSTTNKRITYTLHENGYIRRRIHFGPNARHICGFLYGTGYSQSYPLNYRPSRNTSRGFKTYDRPVPAGPIEQIGILTNRVLKYRQYLVG